jgi:hypothetical protein
MHSAAANVSVFMTILLSMGIGNYPISGTKSPPCGRRVPEREKILFIRTQKPDVTEYYHRASGYSKS